MDITLKSRFQTFVGLTGGNDTLRADVTEADERQRLRLCDRFGVPFSMGGRRPRHDEEVTLRAVSDDDPANVCFPPWSGGDLRSTHVWEPHCRMRIRRMQGDGDVRSGDRVGFCSPQRVTQGGSNIGGPVRRKWLKAGDDNVHTMKIELWGDSPGDGEIFELQETVPLPNVLESSLRVFQTPTWAAGVLVRAAGYSTHAARLRALGYRPVHLHALSAPEPAFVDLWARDGMAIEWRQHVGQTETAMRKRLQDLAAQGFVPTSIARYRHGTLLRFAGVWHRVQAGSSDVVAAQLGTPLEAYQALFGSEGASGRRPRSLHASVEIGGTRLASVFAKLPLGAFRAHHNIDGAAHQQHFGDSAHAGMRPVAMTGWRHSGEDRWASVWRPTTGEWAARHGIDTPQIVRETVQRGARGLEPAFLAGHPATGSARWAGCWVRPERRFTIAGAAGSTSFCAALDARMQSYMQQHNIPGAQLAVTRNGRFLHCRAYTWATALQPPIVPRTRFRLASISKTITASAVAWLVQQGLLDPQARVFDLLGLNPPNATARQRRFARITVDHLLTHTGGWARAEDDAPPGPQDLPDPMMIDEIVALGRAPFTTPVSTRDIAEFVLRERPPDFVPGTTYSYSNFGYCLLGRVIEKVSNQFYEVFVRDKILLPLGAQRMQLGRSAMERRLGDEAPYFTRGTLNGRNVLVAGSNPTAPVAYGGFNLENMDSHGGWVSSAADLLRFTWGLDRDNVDAGNPLLDSTRASMRMVPTGLDQKRVRRDNSNPGNDNDRSNYARGVKVDIASGTPLDLKQSNRIEHNGLLPGTRTEFQQGLQVRWSGPMATTESLGVALLFNRCETDRDLPTDPDGLADFAATPMLGMPWNFGNFIRNVLLPDDSDARPTQEVNTSGA